MLKIERVHMPETFPMGVLEEGSDEQWQSNTVTVRERAMLWLINAITDKPEWWRKVSDNDIVAKWRAELESFVSKGADPLQNGFSDAMFVSCVLELRDKAEVYARTADKDGNGGIVGVLDTAAGVFKADGRVSPALLADLRAAAVKFEDVPEGDKDWHPGSNKQVLDLVHPSLWPLVYGTSLQLAGGKEIGVAESLANVGSGEVIAVPTPADLGLGVLPQTRVWSDRFQWLPAEVSFGADGKSPAEITSYINNAHPEHNKDLYPVIARLVDAALPMLTAAYERTMSWAYDYLPNQSFPERKRIDCSESNRSCTTPDLCVKWCSSMNMPVDAPENPNGLTSDNNHFWAICDDWYNRTHPITQPEPKMYLFPGVSAYQTEGPWFPTSRRRTVGTPTEEEMDAAMERRKAQKADAEARVQRWTKASMEDDKAIKAEFDAEIATAKAEAMAAAAATEGKDHRLQVIVKLANIHLTPENPRYEGGSWHFEGVLNEHICATALYYYDADNVTESRLAFRSISDSEGYSEGDFEYEQGDHEPFRVLYGMSPDMEGDPTAQLLGDVVTREGRLLVFPNVLQHQVQPFELADKTRAGHRKIVALFLVDPAVRVPSSATVPPQQAHWRLPSAVDARLPPELSNQVYEHAGVPFARAKAEALREELMEQRKAIDTSVNEFISEQTWSFCEH